MKPTTFYELVDRYVGSKEYGRLRSDTSKRQYKYWLTILSDTEVDGVRVGDMTIKHIETPTMQLAYDELLNRGPVMACRILSVGRRLFAYAIKYGWCKHNPIKGIEMISTPSRSVIWTPEQVTAYLTTAYSDFKTRNAGLIAQMAYEWGQRIGDMRALTWDMYDHESGVLHLTQSKRRATVHLPASDNLREMLEQQRSDFGWQKYIAPNIHVTVDGGYDSFSDQTIRLVHRKILKRAGLSSDLRLSDMRRTATTEMIEAGVGLAQLMQVTGHANPQSVKPYMKNTLRGATLAMQMRGNRLVE